MLFIMPRFAQATHFWQCSCIYLTTFFSYYEVPASGGSPVGRLYACTITGCSTEGRRGQSSATRHMEAFGLNKPWNTTFWRCDPKSSCDFYSIKSSCDFYSIMQVNQINATSIYSNVLNWLWWLSSNYVHITKLFHVAASAVADLGYLKGGFRFTQII